jgi:hypothetical protein
MHVEYRIGPTGDVCGLVAQQELDQIRDFSSDSQTLERNHLLPAMDYKS